MRNNCNKCSVFELVVELVLKLAVKLFSNYIMYFFSMFSELFGMGKIIFRFFCHVTHLNFLGKIAFHNLSFRAKNNNVPPFEVAIIQSLQKNDKSNFVKAQKIYNLLVKNKIDVLFDDTDEHLSAKFKKFDLIGIPYQIILGSKYTNDKFEFKEI